MRQNGAGEFFYFGKERGIPSERMPRRRCGFYSAAYAAVDHAAFLRNFSVSASTNSGASSSSAGRLYASTRKNWLSASFT